MIISSPFDYLFISNEAPTVSEALLIREAIRNYQSQLNDIHHTIRLQLFLDPNVNRPTSVPKRASVWKKLRRRVSLRRQNPDTGTQACPPETLTKSCYIPELLRERNKIYSVLDSHRALLSPVRRVPPELWSEIFSFCIPDQPFVSPSATEAPLLVGQVCRFWRNVAITTPSIWASLSLNIFRRGTSGPGRSLTPANAFLATTWLSRSRSYPLSLEISWYSASSSMDSLLDIILSHFSRLRHLRLYVPGSSLERMLNNPEVPLPLLQSLEIVTHTLSATNHHTISQTATSLRTLIIPTIYVNPLSLDIPWSQLTFLRSQYCLSTQDSLELISRCTNLSDCTLRIWMVADMTQTASQILLPNLSTLTITSESCLHFLNHLTLPSLQEMTITVVRGRPGLQPPSWLMASLRRLVLRSSCPLKRLRIWDSSVNDLDLVYEEDLLYFLQHAPSVTEIEAVFNGRNQVKGRVFEVLLRRRLS